jgi:4-amino-4-deoxy-L-arabinose transferase-like glycosyltransferase
MSLVPPPAPPHGAVIDIGAVAAHASLTVRPPETPEERLARLTEAAEEAMYRRRKDWWTFVVTILVSVGVGVVALVLAILTTGDLQKWSMSLVTLLLGGAIGYWTGTKTAGGASK